MARNETVLLGLDQFTDWGILTTDAKLIVTGWNHWLEVHSLFLAKEAVGRPLFDAFPELPLRGLDRPYRQALQGQVVVLASRLHPYLLSIPSRGGGSRLSFMRQRVRIAPLLEDGIIVGTLTVIEPITDAAAAATKRQQKIETGEKGKDEYLATLAHELRNPLAPIRNALQVIRLRGTERRQVVREAEEIIERQMENLVRLVDELLDVSRMTRGMVRLQKERVDLAAVVARAVEAGRPHIDARRQVLNLTLPREPLVLEADMLRLGQVLLNLLTNASKFTPEGGRIELTVERENLRGAGESAVIRVRDTGIGIPPEMLPRIFDLFTRVDNGVERVAGGLGIGLTLVRRLTELHGGTVEVVSDGPDRGSEFIVRLPLPSATAPTAGLRQPHAPALTAPASRRRILVVDDNQDAAESLAVLLRLYGNDVRTVYDGPSALRTAAAYRPTVVLLDIGLPGMNGLEICRQLRTQMKEEGPLIVAMTGYGQPDDRDRTRAAGFDAHLVKPLDLEALQDLLSHEGMFQRGRTGTPSASVS